MDIQKVLEEHALWLRGEGGQRANLESAVLKGVSLKGVDLEGVSLWGANLERANLEGANLEGAFLYGARLYGARGIYQFGPMPTSGRFCYAVWHSDHWMVQAGCFWGTLEELEKKVKENHNCPLYLANIELLRNWKYEEKC